MFCTAVKLGRYSDNVSDSGKTREKKKKKLVIESTSAETEKDVGPCSL